MKSASGIVVSIIIPVYNTEAFLSMCLESILSQCFLNFEVLLVDDGSDDNSGVICDMFAEKDNRIRVFHKENEGVSSARNLGLEHACGEWIYFVDSDDEILPDGLQTLVDCISDDVDVVMGGFVEEDECGNVLSIDERVVLSLTKKQSIISLYGGNGSYYHYCGYLWMRLLRRSVIQMRNLRFDTSIAIKEDTLFLMQYICRSNGVTRQTTIPVYKYRRRIDSAMGKVERIFDPKMVDSFYALVKMKHEVEALYPYLSTPFFLAEQAIIGRRDAILDMMDANNVHDDALEKDLSSILHKEVLSMPIFKVRRKIRKVMRRLKES